MAWLFGLGGADAALDAREVELPRGGELLLLRLPGLDVGRIGSTLVKRIPDDEVGQRIAISLWI